MKQIYLDHNATTLIEESAKSALLFFSSTEKDSDKNFGNVSSVHWAGRKLKSAWEEAHEKVAELVGAERPEEICFTSCATESINFAIKGAFFKHLEEGFKPTDFILFTSQVEHEATLESARFIERLGARVFYCPVDDQGSLRMEVLDQALTKYKGRFLFSFMAANNETGIIFPIEELLRRCKSVDGVFHLDAVQALGKMEFSLKTFPVDFASFSAHKIGGPKGVGALYIKRGQKLENLMHGGAQERKRRAGTINVAGVVAFGCAAQALNLVSSQSQEQTQRLRDEFEAKLTARFSGVNILGKNQPRLSNTSMFLLDGVRGEALLMGLDLAGIAVSSGSACNSGSIGPSHVLLAMGFDKVAAASAVRVSFGARNSSEEIDYFMNALEPIVKRTRK